MQIRTYKPVRINMYIILDAGNKGLIVLIPSWSQHKSSTSHSQNSLPSMWLKMACFILMVPLKFVTLKAGRGGHI